ncbi:hypothetical protein GDO81_007289 [Engystomops pustulosus]|uniref:Uncharacterized protein n=1 Tax=Engystomops pustulosus TaxID=76066 RepID=A0AAV7C634_ENGPU|nr:hypothetical protein GDO81_007289 [Engystomops pustulosus]
MIFPITQEYVHDGTAGRLVCFQEEDVFTWQARLSFHIGTLVNGFFGQRLLLKVIFLNLPLLHNFQQLFPV